MRKNGKWIIKETTEIFANDFFTLSLDKVINPDKKDDEYATLQIKDSVAVIAIDDDNNVFLTEQFRYAIEKDNIEAAAGAVEDEDYLAAARRELKEELGIEAQKWDDLGKIICNTSLIKDTKFLFLARNLSFGEPETEKTEEIRQLKISFEEALEKVMSNEILHDVTCLLILKTGEFLKRENEQ